MSKRNYTHIQALLPEIKAMLAEGKTQREVAEHYGFKDKYVVKRLLTRERRKERKLEVGILPRPKGRPRKDAVPFADGKQTAAGFSALHRKEVRAKVKYHIIYRHRTEYPVAVMCKFFGVSRSGYYAFVHRLGRLEKDAALAEDCTTTGTQFPYLRLSSDVALAEKPEYFP